MSSQNRNILVAAAGVVLALCCCIAVTACGSIALGTQLLSQSERGSNSPVAMVTRLVTATPSRAVAPSPMPQQTPEPPKTAQPEELSATPQPGIDTRPDTEAILAEAEMPERDLRDLALRLRPDVTDVPLVVNATPPSYKVGDRAEFWVSNSDTQEHRKVKAALKYVTEHLYIWVEEGQAVDQGDLRRSAERFENETYPTNREFFGSEWTPGVDNDPHLSVLHTTGMGENVAGYYSSADEYSNKINPYSNEREMFYISVDEGSAPPNSSFYDGTLAHEFQHMIHWANDRNEGSWVNEGLSELAAFRNGYDVGGHDIAYSDRPDTQLTTWADPSEGNSEHYGASYLFMNYFLDRFGEELTKAVVASAENGIAGFNEALAESGRSERFDDVYADWVLANYLDAPSADSEGRYGYSEIDPYPMAVETTHRRYPSSETAEVSQYGTDYIRLKGTDPVTIKFEGDAQAKLVDAQTEGSYSWWSNRGDDSDSTLTRAFDLSGLDTATLTFSTWYDIEDGWDYAYVMASTDGGQKWEILPGRYTTEDNPVGNAFGPGWTGKSGGGDAAEWVEEEVDLTRYAGQETLLRFEYVTDDAVNQAGMLLDNIAISELGFSDDCENGTGAWDAAGWALTDNTLAQRWLVQLMEIGDNGVTVKQMEVGPDGRGQLLVDDLGDLEEAVLTISGLTPFTTEKAGYRYSIEAE